MDAVERRYLVTEMDRFRKERDEARDAVKLLAGALVNMMSNSDRTNKMAASEVMRDPIVRRIVEGEL
jgi:hypothetical protein